jgi:hypothetical protein
MAVDANSSVELTTEQAYAAAYRFVAQYYERERIALSVRLN